MLLSQVNLTKQNFYVNNSEFLPLFYVLLLSLSVTCVHGDLPEEFQTNVVFPETVTFPALKLMLEQDRLVVRQSKTGSQKSQGYTGCPIK